MNVLAGYPNAPGDILTYINLQAGDGYKCKERGQGYDNLPKPHVESRRVMKIRVDVSGRSVK